MMLDEGQLRQLVQRGYVVLDAFIDPALTAAARDRLWEFSLPRMRREYRTTHVGPFSEDEHTTDPTGNRRYGFRWQVTAMGREDVLLDLLPRNPAVRAIVAQLLGPSFTDSAPDWSDMGRPEPGAWTRGVYCTLPTPKGDEQPPDAQGRQAACHIDSDLGSRDRLGAIAYIDGVVRPPPLPCCCPSPDDTGVLRSRRRAGGGLGVWPGSHLRLNNLARTTAERVEINARGGADAGYYWPECRAELDAVAEEPPVECHGAAGTLVLYHTALAHMVMPNSTPTIRQGVLGSFGLTAEALPEAERLRHVTSGDLFVDWAPAVRAIPCPPAAPRPAALPPPNLQLPPAPRL